MIKSGEEDLPGSVMCHEWMKEGCHLCYIKGRRKKGRPPNKWIVDTKEDVKLMELNIGEAVNLIRKERNGVVSWQPHRQPIADGREKRREKRELRNTLNAVGYRRLC